MAERDYYDVLGVARTATADDIKKAYRGMARKFHPDVNPGDKSAESSFKEVQQAYDVLSDAEKRQTYDRFGMAAFGGGSSGPRGHAADWAASQGGGRPGAGGAQGGFENIDFSQFFGGGPGMSAEGMNEGGGIFDDLLGRVRGGRGGKRTRGPRPGPAVEAELTIPFLTAVQGGETSFEIARDGGKNETLVVKIPPGVETGAKLRLKGQGEHSEEGGPRGDLTIILKVHSHPYFQRHGRDLVVEVPLSVSEAILGAKIEVPTLDGHKVLPVPAGTSSGQRLRLRGQGVPASGGKPEGDLFVSVKIVTPRAIDDESRALIEQFAARNPQSPRLGLW
ncbi:J domain-containing protein [Isosphaeraceae bacterium EP7]